MENSLRLEPRRRTDGTIRFMEDSEHEEIQVNLKNFKPMVCLQSLCMHGHCMV